MPLFDCPTALTSPFPDDDHASPQPATIPFSQRKDHTPEYSTENRLKDIYMLFNSPSSTSPQEPPQRTPEQQSIITHLESATRAHITAINAQNYDITSPPWTNLSQNFISDVRSVCMKNPRRLNREEYIGQYQWLRSISPAYHLEITSISTELKILTRGVTKADVTVLLENTGNPPGVVRMIASILEWRREGTDGKWECTQVSAARGIDEFEARTEG